MKHILPVLTVTALAAAASAQTAPAPAAKQSPSYNRIVASYVSVSNVGGDAINGASFFAQAKLGSGLYVAASVLDLTADSDDTDAVVGYAYTLPTVFGITTDLNVEAGYKSVGVGLRALIGGGLEIDVAHTHGSGSALDDVFTVGAIYNLGFIAKGLTLNASYSSFTGEGAEGPGSSPDVTQVGIGYNF